MNMAGENDEGKGAAGTEGTAQQQEQQAQAQAPAAGAEGAAAGAEGVAASDGAGKAPAAAPATSDNVDWRERRIATLTARLREAQEALAAKPAASATDGAAAAKPAAPALSEAELQARVEARAAELAASKAFNDACNAVATKGREAYGETEFNGRVAELVKLRDVNDPASVANYNSFLAAAIETGQAEKLIDMLGRDLNEAARVLALPPVRMGIELARLAERDPEEVSKAPKPIKPIGAKGSAHTEIDPTDPTRAGQLSTAEWMRRREAQIAKRQGRQQ